MHQALLRHEENLKAKAQENEHHMKQFEESIAFEQRKSQMDRAKKNRVMYDLKAELDRQVAHKQEQEA
jgi:hypothetical protein